MEDRFTDQEKQLKALGDRFSIDLDTDDLWNNVESRLPPEEDGKRRPVAWWFVGGVSVALLGLLLWVLPTQSIQDNKAGERSTIAPKQKDLADLLTEYEGKHTQMSPNASFAIDDNQKSKLKKENRETKELHTNSSTLIETRKVIAKTNQSKKDQIKRTLTGPETTSTGRLLETLTENTGVEDHMNVPQKEISDRTNALISVTAITSLGFQPIQYAHQNENFIERVVPFKQVIPVKTAAWLPFFALTSGINTHLNHLQSNTGEHLNLEQFEEEKPLVGLSSDFRVGFENSNGWRFGMGVNHSRLVNRYSRTQPDTVSVQIPGSVSSKIDADGNITDQDGNLLQTTITNYNVHWHRVHDFVNLQLNVGKKIVKSEKISVFADAILSRNIWSNHTGYYFTKDNTAIQKFSGEENHPYTNSGFNLGLSMDIEYKLNDISISLRPFTMVGLNNITQNSNYYLLKNSHYGVQLGIVYRP
ncbi:MAG: hypothetical protein AAGA77_13890 [Bacteroidota bacterium]